MFSMGASLDGEKYDTKKEDKKKQPNKSILPKNQHQLVFTYDLSDEPV